MSVETFRVARREFTAKNALNFGAVIERDGKSIKEVVFVELSEYGQRGITLRFDALELRALGYAIRALYKSGASSFTKGAGTDGSQKRLWVTKGDKGYFINAREGERMVGFQLDAYRWIALADAVMLLADEVEKALYRVQAEG